MLGVGAVVPAALIQPSKRADDSLSDITLLHLRERKKDVCGQTSLPQTESLLHPRIRGSPQAFAFAAARMGSTTAAMS